MKARLCAVLFAVFLPAAAAAAPPTVFFSDIVSGPKTGGRGNNGAIVTVYGESFGREQGDGYVTVGGGRAADYLLWNDTRVSFQLGPDANSGVISVTTSAGTSNGVPFTVRPGNIYFVDDTSPNDPGAGTFEDPWRSPALYYGAMQPGDICYFRAGVYPGKYGAQRPHYNVALGPEAPNGSPNNEIAWIGYPDEAARFEARTSDVAGNFSWEASNRYYVVAGLQLYATSRQCVRLTGSYNRIVGNSCEGLKETAYSIINPADCHFDVIYGNELFGATTGNKLDHPIYVGYGTDDLEIGWNHFHDNDVGVGPVISINYDNAATENVVFENIRIHDNVIDCRNSSAGLRAIGIVSAAQGTSVFIYDNVVIQGGGTDSWNYCVYQYAGKMYFYNNTLYNTRGAYSMFIAPMVDGQNIYRPELTDIRNNIFYNQEGCDYILVKEEAGMGQVVVDNNCYYGNGNGPARDSHALNADPLFVDPENMNFRLQPTSPCIDAGVNTAGLVLRDIKGVFRPQNAAVDIGAHEFFTGEAGDAGLIEAPAGAERRPLIVMGSAEGRGTVNPDRGETVKIYFNGTESGTYKCLIFTLTGETVWESSQENVQEGVFEWAPGDVASGVYVVHVRGPSFKETKKVAILR